MTDSEIRAAILADSTAKALCDKGDDAGAARRLAAALPPSVGSCFLDERGIFASFDDPGEAAAFLGGLQAAATSDPILARALLWIETGKGGVDVGHPRVRAMLDGLAAGGAIAPASVATLKRRAEGPADVSVDQVSRAWLAFRPAGKVQG